MIQKNNKKINIITNQNYQCHCFQISQPKYQYFLSHHNVDNKYKSTLPPSRHTETENRVSKSRGKLSLKKNNSISSQNLISNRSKEGFNDYGQIQQTKKESKELKSQYIIKSIDSAKQSRKLYDTQKKATQHLINRNNNHHITNWHSPPHNPYYSPPTTSYRMPLSPPHLITPPNKINFHPNGNIISFQVNHPQNSKNDKINYNKPIASTNQLKQSCKLEHRQSKQSVNNEEIIQFTLTEDNMDSPRMMPVCKKSELQLPLGQKYFTNQNRFDKPNQYFTFRQTFKSNIQKIKPNNQQTINSKIIVNHSQAQGFRYPQIDIPKLKIGGKGKQEKRQKKSLKKINDVQQIRSLGDSDCVSDSKQSVVLGRLREYGSTFQPNLSTSATLGSKLVSLNTQSSIGRSFMKSFVFNSQKNQYK